MKADNLDQLVKLVLDTGRLIRVTAKTHGLSPDTALRIEALQFIDDMKTPTMRELADSFSITPPSATILVRGLEKAGYVERTSDAHDRRIVRLKLTPAGRKALQAGSAQIRHHLREIFSRLSPHDRTTLEHIFANLAATYHV